MPSLRSIFSLLALGSVMVENPMPQRLLSRAIHVVALVVLGSMFLGAFVLALIAYAYKAMIAHGISDTDAMLYVLGTIFLVGVGVIIAAYNSATDLIGELKSTAKKPVPITEHLGNQAGSLVESFVSGFLSSYNNKTNL